MRSTVVGIVASVVLGTATPCLADTITQYGAGGLNLGTINSLLTTTGIPPIASSETIAESFFVPGGSGTTTTMTFNFVADTGGFFFTFGFFDLASVSAAPGNQQAFGTQALSGGTVVFSDVTQNPPATASFPVLAGTNLGFFLIPNNTLAGFLANPGSFDYDNVPGLFDVFRAPLYSVTGANPGGFDQMLSFVGGGKTMFAFEDLARNPNATFISDNSFTDLVFSIDTQLEPGGTPAAVPEPGSIVLLGSGLAGLARAAVRRRRSRRG